MNETVPFIGLAKEVSETKAELMKAVEKVLESGNYVLGPEVASFEKEFASLCDAKFALGLDNGTHSMIIMLRKLNLKSDDEVITAPNSFIASASSIALAGGRPVFCDIGPDLNMDPEALERAITPKTRAIMPVHLTGRPAKMKEIMAIAKKRGLFVLEDAAQSVGAKLGEQTVGSMGHVASFSLHPLKNLHAFGDGGMFTTNDPDFASWMLKARNHGLMNRNECEFWSYNSRLDEIQAAMLRVQLKHLPRYTQARRALAKRYNEALKDYVDVPIEAPGEYHIYQTYMIQADHRDRLEKHLNSQGVEARVHYPITLPFQPAAAYLGYRESDLPVAVRASKRILSLPCHPTLTFEQQDRAISLIKDFYERQL